MAADLERALGLLGYDAFRPGQREAIETLLSRGRLLLVAPTGGGKSLSYQLPALLLGGTTLVISPLVALMQDQVEALERRGIAATFLAATLAPDEHRRRSQAIAAGAFRLVYASPERLALPGFQAMIARLGCPLVAVDEAHCISEWGHDFRPEYMQLGELLRTLAPAHVLACTATATPVVRDEILMRLGLGPETPQIVQGFARPGLVLRARSIEHEAGRKAAVDDQLAEALGEPGSARGAAIVYAPTRRSAEHEAERLGRRWHAAPYHAGLSGEERDRTLRRFSERALDVVVATNAFGMGIDRADVRSVIHLAPPGSLEAYYQEVGRAGRDGDTAWALLLSSSRDLPLRRRLVESEIEGRRPSAAVVEHKWSLFLELLRWIEAGSCRQQAILRYFDTSEEAATCGVCDNCVALEDGDGGGPDEETTLYVRKALSGVARVHGRFGLGAAVQLLCGRADPRLERSGLDRVPTFGVLAPDDPDWVLRLLRRCIAAAWIDFTGADRPVVALTDAGREVMLGRRPARVLLPPRGGGKAERPRKRGHRAEVEAELDGADELLFQRLRAHRLERARAEGVPPYVIASDRTLREIARLRPGSPVELEGVQGIGPTKLARYGTELLAVVRDHG